jgi:hypothetical protein
MVGLVRHGKYLENCLKKYFIYVYIYIYIYIYIKWLK